MEIKIILSVIIVMVFIVSILYSGHKEEGFSSQTSMTFKAVENVTETFASITFEDSSAIITALQNAGNKKAVVISFDLGIQENTYLTARFIVLGMSGGRVHVVTMTDDRKGAGGTLSVNQQRLLRNFPGQRKTITIELRSDLFIPIDNADTSIISSGTNGAFSVINANGFGELHRTIKVYWSPAVLIPHDMSSFDNKSLVPVPPFVYIRYELTSISQNIVSNQRILGVASEACRFYASPQYTKSQIRGIALLGGEMRGDAYFYYTLSSLDPNIPIPRQLYDVEENIRKHIGDGQSCSAMFAPVKKTLDSNDPNKKFGIVSQESASKCLSAATVEKMPIDVLKKSGASTTSLPPPDISPPPWKVEDAVTSLNPCEIVNNVVSIGKVLNKDMYEHNVSCAVKAGQNPNVKVFPPEHPIWLIPDPPAEPSDVIKMLNEFYIEGTFRAGTKQIWIEKGSDARTRLANEFYDIYNKSRTATIAVVYMLKANQRVTIKSASNQSDKVVLNVEPELPESGKYSIIRIVLEPVG